MKYRKKPVVVEAEKWDGNFLKDIIRYTDSETRECEHCGEMLYLHGWINTLEGGHIVCPGDWIITGVKGERYPCKPDIFEQTYEKVTEDRDSSISTINTGEGRMP